MKRRQETGQVFILVLILLALVPLLIIPLLKLSYTNLKYHQLIEINTLNAYAADSGVEYARYQIYNNPAEIQETPLSENLTINNIDVHVSAHYEPAQAGYSITSTATKAERSETVEVTIVVDVGLFGNVVACNGNLTLDHCTFENPDYPGESDVYTSGNVHLIQSTVDGDVNTSGIYTDDGHSTVTGDINQEAALLEFPPIDTDVHKERALVGGNSSGINWNNQGTKNLGPLYIDGNLTIDKTDVILEGTVYVTGDVFIDRAKITGFGDILAGGNFEILRYSIDIGDSLILPILMSIYEDIILDRDTEGYGVTYAIVYAPNGTISVNQVELHGSVASLEVILNQSVIFYPAELRGRADLPGAGLDTVTYIFD